MEFWKQLITEHGIGKDGMIDTSLYSNPSNSNNSSDLSSQIGDRKDVFFYQVNKFICLNNSKFIIIALLFLFIRFFE